MLYKRKRIIHLHSNNTGIFLLLNLVGFRHKIGVTLHNKRLINKKSVIKKKIIKGFLKQASFVLINDTQYKKALLNKGWITDERSYILPAFIPPTCQERSGINTNIRLFRGKYSFLISANTSKLSIENGIDIYGFDLLIELIHALGKKGIDAGLVFCLPQTGDIDYYKKCLDKIQQYGISEHIMILSTPMINGFEIWELSDLFIRPTLTDIEGISVKEALFCHTPAIASDVCSWPPSTILFKNRDFNDLLKKVLDVYYHKTFFISDVENPVSKIMQIYKDIESNAMTK